MDADFRQVPVIVTSGFLHNVHRHLTTLATSFGEQEMSARHLLRATRNSVGTAEESWTGPRSAKLVDGARTYLDIVDEYPKALSAAVTTLGRWAAAALWTAEILADLERQTISTWMPDRTMMPTCGVDGGCIAPDASVLAGIDAVRETWARTCVAFGAELDGAVSAITTANEATAIPVNEEQAEQLRVEMALRNLSGPAEVRAGWSQLSDGERLTLLATCPGLISGLDGVPARAQAIAARARSVEELMRLESAEAEGTLTPEQGRRLAHLRATLGEGGGTYPVAGSHDAHYVAAEL